MKKNEIIKILKEIMVKEMARIPLLYQLSTTDEKELEKLMPQTLKNSGIAKNIIKFFIDNNNTPSSTVQVAKAFGYKAQQPVNTQFQHLKAAGVLQDKGLAFAKKEKSTSLGQGQGRPISSPEENSPEQNVTYLLLKLKRNENPKDSYKNWFITSYGEENYNKFTDLVSKLQTNLKDEYNVAKNNLREFLVKLGLKVGKQGRKPMEINPPKDLGNFTQDNDGNELSLAEKNSPAVKPQPGIKEPPVKDPVKSPKRRTLTPPDPTVKPTPKNEQKSEKYGWDQKKGLTQLKKPEVKGSNKPKEEKPKNENKEMLKKIVDKYTKLKNETKN